MCQGVVRMLFNHFQSSQVRKVASLLAEPLRGVLFGSLEQGWGEGMERPQRYCTNCGAQVNPGGAFCGSCGTRLSQTTGDTARTRDVIQEVRERISGYALPSYSRFPALGKDSLLG